MKKWEAAVQLALFSILGSSSQRALTGSGAGSGSGSVPPGEYPFCVSVARTVRSPSVRTTTTVRSVSSPLAV
ncbi:hypothetical protein INF32_05190 [Rikenellaceae bacterium DSM 108975]|nr:hypothetical protein [Gallalistipes aquisgranensis]MBE5033339.1 hypothetical protein [Gallalistipes aquisgranensis]